MTIAEVLNILANSPQYDDPVVVFEDDLTVDLTDDPDGLEDLIRDEYDVEAIAADVSSGITFDRAVQAHTY